MKLSVRLFKIFCTAMLCAYFIISCKKNDNGGGPINPGGPTNADTLSNHLQFPGATKIQGIIPQGALSNSLKISFKDTLYFMGQIMKPMKFLHLNTVENVAGIFLQVQALINGSFADATHYYDIPEAHASDSSDTVSVITGGFDLAGLKLPLTFNVKIIPYNKNKQPIAEAIRPVKISGPHADPTGNGGSCGLVLPTGEYWEWVESYTYKEPLPNAYFSGIDFYSAPDKIWLPEGQMIKGSCCAGISIYGICPGNTQPNASLHFATYYQIQKETLVFFNNGTYLRQTFEESPIPLPDSSNFCAGGEGRVKYNLNHTLYNGNWTIAPAILPPDLQAIQHFGYHDSLTLRLQQTSSSGGGYGNGGGIIRGLECNTGDLFLIQVDPEGFGRHLYKWYERRLSGGEAWWKFS